MRHKVPIQWEARFWFPDYSDRLRWRWHRVAETLHFDLPGPMETMVHHLPPRMFTFSAVDLTQLRFHTYEDGKTLFSFQYNNHELFRDVELRETSLWSQVRFDPLIDGPNNRLWTLRWRFPNATNDMWAKTYAYLKTQDDPEAQQLRREITLMMLGSTAPTP